MKIKTIKVVILLFLELSFINVYSQKCEETLGLINQSDNKSFSDASLLYNIVKYMECIQSPKTKIDFFKSMIFLVKHNDVYIAKNIENTYFIIDKDFNVIKETENRIGFTDNFNQLIENKIGISKRSEQLINKKGEPISAEYDDITFLSNNHIEVLKDRKFGVIDSTGKVIVPLLYSEIESYTLNVFNARINKLKGIINSQNQILLPFEYSEIEHSDNINFFAVEKDEKYGIVNKNNQVVVPFEYRRTKVVNDNCFLIISDYGSYFSDQAGEQISKTYSRINQFFNLGNDLYTEVEESFGSGVISLQTMKEVIAPEFEEVRVRENFISIKNDGLFGIASFDGSILIPPIYEEKFYSHNRFNKVKKNSKYGIIDHNGKQIKDFIYDEIFIYRDYVFFNDYDVLSDDTIEKDFVVLVESGRSQIVDLKTNQVIANYDFEVDHVYKEFFWVKKNGLWGTFSPKTNSFIVKFKYDNPVLQFNNGLAIIQRKEKYGVLNFKGKEIQAPKYDDFSSASVISSDSVLILKNNDKRYYINLFGKIFQK